MTNFLQRLKSSVGGAGDYGGVAHTNKFMVLITAPFGTTTSEIGGLTLRCDAVAMPGRTMNTTPNSERYGPTTQMVDGWTFEDVTCSFLADEKFKVKDFFSEWQYRMYGAGNPISGFGSPTPSFNIGFYEDYVNQIDIYTLNQDGKKTHGVRLVEAFPKTINANEFNMETTNQLQKVSVSFAYRYWHEISQENTDEDLDEDFAGRPVARPLDQLDF